MMEQDDGEESVLSHTELDTHEVTIVVGRNILIINDTGETVNVELLIGTLKKVLVVDCVVVHGYPYINKAYYLVIYNALHPQIECYAKDPSPQSYK